MRGKGKSIVIFQFNVQQEQVKGRDSALTLDDGRELPVSRSRQKEVKRQYIAFIK